MSEPEWMNRPVPEGDKEIQEISDDIKALAEGRIGARDLDMIKKALSYMYWTGYRDG
jgi:hypothetical protein